MGEAGRARPDEKLPFHPLQLIKGQMIPQRYKLDWWQWSSLFQQAMFRVPG